MRKVSATAARPLRMNVSPAVPSVPPLTMSMPSVGSAALAFQMIVSSPARVLIVSLPWRPVIVSLPAVPLRVLSPLVAPTHRW